MNIRSFSIPRNYIFGWNSLSEISKFVLKKPLIVTDKKVMTDTGHLTKLLDELEHEYDSILILDISKEPSFADLKETWIKCKEYSPDSIIALGGGAVIDIAKALNYLMNNQSTSIEQFINDGIPFESTVRINDKSSNLIAIPTTSGTGSEVTCAAVYSHPATRTKKWYLSSQVIPDTAILDPELTVMDLSFKTASTHINRNCVEFSKQLQSGVGRLSVGTCRQQYSLQRNRKFE